MGALIRSPYRMVAMEPLDLNSGSAFADARNKAEREQTERDRAVVAAMLEGRFGAGSEIESMLGLVTA